MRRLRLAALAAVLAASSTLAQEPRFEVASVRPHRQPDDTMFALQFHDGGRLTATGTLRMLIRTAYALQEFQVDGPHGWIDDERFEIDARAGADATPDQMRVMLRALLEERFGLTLRPEKRASPIYALSVTNGGTAGRLRRAAKACPGACGIRFAPGVLEARGVTMTMLASELSSWVDRVVVDRTRLLDRFDLDLEWAPDRVPSAPLALSTSEPPTFTNSQPAKPSIFTAVREQLGLSLEPARGDVDVFVIDGARRPSTN